jgi:hypothetical protein
MSRSLGAPEILAFEMAAPHVERGSRQSTDGELAVISSASVSGKKHRSPAVQS